MVEKATDAHEARQTKAHDVTSAKLSADSQGGGSHQGAAEYAKLRTDTKHLQDIGTLPPCTVAEVQNRLKPCGGPAEKANGAAPGGHPEGTTSAAKSGEKPVGAPGQPSETHGNSPTEKTPNGAGHEKTDATKAGPEAGKHPADTGHHEGHHHHTAHHHKAHHHTHHHKEHHPGHHKAHHGHAAGKHGETANASPGDHKTATNAREAADAASTTSTNSRDNTPTAGKAEEQKPGENSSTNNPTSDKANEKSGQPQGAADGTMVRPGQTNDQAQTAITAAETKKANEGCPADGALPHESPKEFMDALKSYGYVPGKGNDGKAVAGAQAAGPSDGKAVGSAAGHPGIPNDGRLQGHAVEPSQALTGADKAQTPPIKSIGDPAMTKVSNVGDVDPGMTKISSGRNVDPGFNWKGKQFNADSSASKDYHYNINPDNLRWQPMGR
jgi:hypothetical protein